METKICVVSIINSITETSMPFNEFILYRHLNFSNISQEVIVCSNQAPKGINIPNELSVYFVGYGGKKLRKAINTIEARNKKDNIKIIYHIHQPRAALIFYFGLLFIRYTKTTIFTIHSLFSAYDIKNKILSLLAMDWLHQIGQFFSEHDIIKLGGENHVKKIL